MPAVSYTLRPARADDADFLWQLQSATLRDAIVATWGRWDEAEQRNFFTRGFDPARAQIVLIDGEAAGRLEVRREPTEIHLDRIQISPARQGRGVGSALMRELMNESAASHRTLHLRVLRANHRAHALYQRLGFATVETTATHHRMVWTPPTS